MRTGVLIVRTSRCTLPITGPQVGGVPEVLPPHMLLLADPSPSALLKAVEEALPRALSIKR